MIYQYYGNGMFASADLKRTAHRVRMAMDHGKAESRKRRLVSVPGPNKDDKPIICAPELKPKDRHALYTGGRRRD